MTRLIVISIFFFFNDTATTEIYTLSLHDALPIYRGLQGEVRSDDRGGAGGRPGRGGGRRRGRGRRGCSRRGADGVHRHPEERRREEDSGDQGDPGDHQPGLEGSQGPGGRRARHGEGRRVQAGSGRDQEEARGSGRGRRTEVVTSYLLVYASPSIRSRPPLGPGEAGAFALS